MASVMCAYGVLNGINDCSDPSLYRLLRSWGFTGFVRSDLGAVDNPAAAFRAGLDLIKPSSADDTKVLMARAVHERSITQGMLDEAITTVLTEMFAFGLIAHPRTLDVAVAATTPADSLTALQVAERSAVLLKNADGLLPLARSPGLDRGHRRRRRSPGHNRGRRQCLRQCSFPHHPAPGPPEGFRQSHRHQSCVR